MRDLRDVQQSLNQTQKVRLQTALQQLQDLYSRASGSAASASVAVADAIPVNLEDGVLKGHGTSDRDGQVVATLCGVVERVNKLVYVRALRSRYKPETGDIIVGRVIEVVQKRWRLDINFSQDAVLMLSSMNLPDGIQRRRTATDELNMRAIFEENDVLCAEVRGFNNDGSLHLQARSQKYGKLARGQLLMVPPYLVKRRKQHFHHLEQYDVDLIIGCNGYIWVGEHVQPAESNMDQDSSMNAMQEPEEQHHTPLKTREHICRIANAVRVLAILGFTISIEVIIGVAESSCGDGGIDIKDMLGAEFIVQTAEKEVKQRKSLIKKRG